MIMTLMMIERKPGGKDLNPLLHYQVGVADMVIM